MLLLLALQSMKIFIPILGLYDRLLSVCSYLIISVILNLLHLFLEFLKLFCLGLS